MTLSDGATNPHSAMEHIARKVTVTLTPAKCGRKRYQDGAVKNLKPFVNSAMPFACAMAPPSHALFCGTDGPSLAFSNAPPEKRAAPPTVGPLSMMPSRASGWAKLQMSSLRALTKSTCLAAVKH